MDIGPERGAYVPDTEMALMHLQYKEDAVSTSTLSGGISVVFVWCRHIRADIRHIRLKNQYFVGNSGYLRGMWRLQVEILSSRTKHWMVVIGSASTCVCRYIYIYI